MTTTHRPIHPHPLGGVLGWEWSCCGEHGWHLELTEAVRLWTEHEEKCER